MNHGGRSFSAVLMTVSVMRSDGLIKRSSPALILSCLPPCKICLSPSAAIVRPPQPRGTVSLLNIFFFINYPVLCMFYQQVENGLIR